MSKLVVLGVAGEAGYWLVDLDAGTVSSLPDTEKEPFAFSEAARSKGAKLVAGIDLAVALGTQDGAFSGRFDAFSGRFDA